MAQTNITVKGSSDIDLTNRVMALTEIGNLPTDVLKRLQKLTRSAKAKDYLSSDLKFAILQKFV